MIRSSGFLFVCCLFCGLSCAAQIKSPQTKSARTKLTQSKPVQSKTSRIKALLQDNWWGQEYDEHAVFMIEGDSITFIEHFDKFKYKISGDTFDLITKQPHYKEIILKLTKDSLIFKELPAGTVSRYGRGN